MVSQADVVLRINMGVTAAEVIDGEAVMINLSDGMYYTMDGIGAEVWLLLERGCSVRAMARWLSARHRVDEDRVLTDVGAVVDELVAAGLVLRDEHASVADEVEVEVAAAGPAIPYVAPQVVRYSDMGDVLALDPPLPLLEPTPEP